MIYHQVSGAFLLVYFFSHLIASDDFFLILIYTKFSLNLQIQLKFSKILLKICCWRKEGRRTEADNPYIAQEWRNDLHVNVWYKQ